jgi:non-ribosomal peptide synthetase component E (peptide arylation enzyme)
VDYAPAPLPEELTVGYRAAGLQTDATLPALMRRNLYEFGSSPCLLDGERVFTWRQLLDAAFRFAGFLQAHDVGPGDVVVWQLPNWWEAVAVAYAVWGAGAVSAPVVPTYRDHELRGVLESVRPRCVIPADLARRCEDLQMNPRRAYAMTECPTVSASSTFDPPAVRLMTDGRLLPGCEVRVLSLDGRELGSGEDRLKAGTAGA